MKKNDKYEIEYDGSQKEADKIIRLLSRAEVPDSAIDYSDDENEPKLLVDSEYSDICDEVMEKYNTLKDKREAKSDTPEE